MRSGLAFSLFILSVFAGLCLLALQLSHVARLMPLVIGVPGLALVSILIYKEWKARTRPGQETDVITMSDVRAILWLAAFFIGILLFGFVAGAPVVTAAYFHLELRCRIAATLGAALACFLLTYGLFEKVLDVPLFHGLAMP